MAGRHTACTGPGVHAFLHHVALGVARRVHGRDAHVAQAP